jgi:hypothetical protein
VRDGAAAGEGWVAVGGSDAVAVGGQGVAGALSDGVGAGVCNPVSASTSDDATARAGVLVTGTAPGSRPGHSLISSTKPSSMAAKPGASASRVNFGTRDNCSAPHLHRACG